MLRLPCFVRLGQRLHKRYHKFSFSASASAAAAAGYRWTEIKFTGYLCVIPPLHRFDGIKTLRGIEKSLGRARYTVRDFVERHALCASDASVAPTAVSIILRY